ncbi:MAG: methyltransferase domain-containing protein [Patescibacteria group bacterium]|jgi:2-polyprenyl-3-methyl-5-hydroxy-6-metoxy-1,4-benzoquinol methylase
MNNLQGGDNNLYRDFYELAFSYIRNGDKLLNLGCGIKFNFEKALTEVKQVKITSCDIIDCFAKPNFVAEYINRSVEEKLDLSGKFDVVTFFELIEHIDKTDELLKNCFNNLKADGYLIFSFPNLASIYARIELLLGFQPHILEASNLKGNFGAGIFGRHNNPSNSSIHHLRGLTHRAMKEMVDYYGFNIIKTIGYDYKFKKLLYFFPTVAPVNIFICKRRSDS